MLAEVLLVILVITMGASLVQQENNAVVDVVRFKAISPHKTAEPVTEPEPEKTAPAEKQVAEPRPPKPAEPKKAPPQEVPQPRPQPVPPKAIALSPRQTPSANIAPQPPSPPAVSKGKQFGPPDLVGAPRDSAVVGTAPNGDRLYAASWYREPYEDELKGYLSTASGPGWGLIACRTAADYRVEDCVAVDEYPTGSNINRAILAAAWQFRVRPPRVGGQPKIGEWVRIRITYGLERR